MPLPAEAARSLDDLGRFGIHLGLDHVRRLAGALGEPQLAVPTVLVAGTNGKGSTAALLAAMAGAAGLRTGLYTSPHLEDVCERLRLDGRPVDGAVLGDAVLAAVAAARRVLDAPPTYFEALTAAAWLVLRDAAVDLAVIEVGLGGRLDATNVAAPRLSVITPISLEHREVLGDTLTAVAGEKAGVLRRGRPAVAWGAEPEVREALAAAAEEVGADLSFADDEVRIVNVEPLKPVPWGGLRVRLETPLHDYDLATPLAGRHQAVNLALAVRAAERLAEAGEPGQAPPETPMGEERGSRDLDATAGGGDAPRREPIGEGRATGGPGGAGDAAGRGFEIGPAAIRRGAAAVGWPGRLESVVVGAPPVRVLLDAAHNPHGAAALAAFLDEAAAAGSRPPVLVFGVLRDKQAEAMLPPLARRAGRVVLTRPPGERGRDPDELRALLAAALPFEVLPVEVLPVEVLPEPAAALRRALDLAAAAEPGGGGEPPPDRSAPPGGGAATVVVCGSIFLVGAARRWLHETQPHLGAR